jgi:hypothetical protein
MIAITFLIFSAFATEEPPNFKTFMKNYFEKMDE